MILSPRALLALTATSAEVQTPSQLLTNPYTTAPQSSGLTAQEYRELRQEHGEGFRYWDAIEAPGTNRNGKVFVETELAEGVKAFFYSSERDVQDAEHGLTPIGDTQFSCLPADCEVTPGGRVLRSDPAQAVKGIAQIEKGEGNLDPLPQRFVRAILSVTVNGLSFPLDQVEAVATDSLDDNDSGGLRWLSNAPAVGSSVFVSFSYSRLYVCLGEGMRGSPTGADGERLPVRVYLRQCIEGE